MALRRAIESYPEDISVAVIATGGLSHQVHGQRAGFNAPAWDREFLNLIVNDPESIAAMSQAELALKGGWESAEVVMWLVMRGALSANVSVKAKHYYLPSMTGIATLLLENLAPPVAAAAVPEKYVPDALAPPQTYPFTLDVSVRAFALNEYLHRMVDRQHRELFKTDQEESLRRAGLSPEECDLIRRRDWDGLIQAGAIFFGLEKLAAVLGLPNATVYAAMRGETLENFQKSRNAPGALYSVGSKL
jgi:gallate dioxygenase